MKILDFRVLYEKDDGTKEQMSIDGFINRSPNRRVIGHSLAVFKNVGDMRFYNDHRATDAEKQAVLDMLHDCFFPTPTETT